MSAVSTTKRLAKNSVLMYMRMAILMLITLYTSRVVLNQLGVEDYGIYNIVGSVVMMFSGLRSMFAASTQRFLNYEMGKGADYNLKTVFNTSIVVNIIVSILFILIAEIFGIWFLNNKINVDPSRLFAAKCVFQFSVITTVISIVNTTFDAEVIAHEKMNFFAYMSIIEGILKLAVVYLLSITSFDSLIFYGLLQMSVTIFVFAIHLIYCRSKFEECKVSFNINMEYLKKMTGFAGWNFLGTNTFMLVQSGMNMVLNVFGGPIVNAARGIAYQINNVVTQFITNVVIVINPYCTKL